MTEQIRRLTQYWEKLAVYGQKLSIGISIGIGIGTGIGVGIGVGIGIGTGIGVGIGIGIGIEIETLKPRNRPFHRKNTSRLFFW